jgi:tetratricopeptide (TPR) repeat protein
MSEFQRADEYFETAERYCQRALAAWPDDARFLFLQASTLVAMSDAAASAGDWTRSDEHAQAAMTACECLTRLHPDVYGFDQMLSLALERSGDAAFQRFDYGRSIELQRRVLAISERLVAANPGNLVQRQNLSITTLKLGDLVAFEGSPEEAHRLCEAALASMRELVGLEPGNLRFRSQLGITLLRLGARLQSENDLEGALRSYSEAQEVLQQVAEAEPRVLHHGIQLGDVCEALSELYWLLQDDARAREWTLRNLAVRRRTAELPEASVKALNNYAWALLTCFPEELRDSRAALEPAQRAVELTHENDAAVLDTFAMACFETGDAARAVAAQERAVALLGTQDAMRVEEYSARLERYRAEKKR